MVLKEHASGFAKKLLISNKEPKNLENVPKDTEKEPIIALVTEGDMYMMESIFTCGTCAKSFVSKIDCHDHLRRHTEQTSVSGMD